MTDNEKKLFVAPFSEETGATVAFVDSTNPESQGYLQVQNNQVNLDLILGASAILAGPGYLEPFPDDLVAVFKENLRPEAFSENIVEKGTGAAVIACNPAVMKKCPTNPQEFWDLENFPGPRGAIADPEYNLHIGLLAAGAPSSAFDPINIDDAIASWEKVKSGINVWTTSGAQQMQVMLDGEVGAQFMYNGRAHIVKRDNLPDLQVSWDGCVGGGISGYGVLKGAPNKDVAFAYLEWIARHPEAQAAWAEAVTYTVPGKNVLDLMTPEARDSMPEAHECIRVDNTWRAEHSDEIKQKWQQFIGG